MFLNVASATTIDKGKCIFIPNSNTPYCQENVQRKILTSLQIANRLSDWQAELLNYIYSLCVGIGCRVCSLSHVRKSEDLWESVLLSYHVGGIQGLKSGHQHWQQGSLPAQLSHCPQQEGVLKLSNSIMTQAPGVDDIKTLSEQKHAVEGQNPW